MENAKIFLSHAAKDKALADGLVDLIQTGANVIASDVFCTSLEGLDVPSGRDFIAYIKGQIQQPQVVILLLTENYLASQFCLAELGASWAMSHHALPLLVPPLTYADVKGVLIATQFDKIDDVDDLSRFFDSLIGFMHTSPPIARLRKKQEQFLTKLPAILTSLERPLTINPVEFKKIKDENDDYARSIEQYEKENEHLRQLVTKLEKLKNREEVVATKLESMGEMQALMAQIAALKNALSNLPTIVGYVMFREFDGHPVRFNSSEEREALAEVGSAIREDYLVDDDGFKPNEADPKVKIALKALRELKKYIRERATPELEEAFENKYGYRLMVENQRLWKEHLAAGFNRYS